MKRIPLSKKGKHGGKFFALVDDGDYEELNKYHWQAQYLKTSKIWYARRVENEKYILMHRQIMNCPEGMLVDHKDFDGLNCQRNNLRLATKSQNNAHRQKPIAITSQYFGVGLHVGGKYRARLQVNGRSIWLGLFDKERDAAKAYNIAALEYHGEFASLNKL